MARVSSKKLKMEVLKRINLRFAEGVTLTKDKKSAALFLQELLGAEEQLMLAKRLAAIYMIAEDISAYRIAKTLGLSAATVFKMKNNFDEGDYDFITTQYRRKKQHEVVWPELATLLRLGMPPMAGPGRWKWFYDLEDKYK